MRYVSFPELETTSPEDGPTLPAAALAVHPPAVPLLHPAEPGAGEGWSACPPPLPPLPFPSPPPGPDPGPHPLYVPPLLCHHHQETPGLSGQGAGAGEGGGEGGA